MKWLGETISRLQRGEAVVVVTVLGVQGSAPRPPGTKMLIAADGVTGTVGGGAFEHRALARAQALLAEDGGRRRVVDTGLGKTALLFERLDAGDLPVLLDGAGHLAAEGGLLATPLDRPTAAKQSFAWPAAPPPLAAPLLDGASAAVVTLPDAGAHLVERLLDRRTRVWLFGAGHVGRALAGALAPLPFHLTWIDDRPGLLPAATPDLRPVCTAAPADEVADAPAGALIVTMSHSHALDFAVVEAALRRDDLGFVGMIASQAKKAECVRRCRAHGLSEARIARLTAPLGIPGIGGREPEVIAASVAAQLLQVADAQGIAEPAAAATV